MTPTATWASARALLVVTDRRLLWLLDDVVTARVQWLRLLAHRVDPLAAAAAAAARGDPARGERRRAAAGVLRAAPADRGGDRPARPGRDGLMDEGVRDRRGLAVLATGHLWADFLQGAIPALLPFLIVRARLLLRGGGGAGARLERRLLARPAAVRDRLGPPRAAVADAGRAGNRRRGAGGHRVHGELPGDGRRRRGQRPRRRGVPPGGRALRELRVARAARARDEHVLARAATPASRSGRCS